MRTHVRYGPCMGGHGVTKNTKNRRPLLCRASYSHSVVCTSMVMSHAVLHPRPHWRSRPWMAKQMISMSECATQHPRTGIEGPHDNHAAAIDVRLYWPGLEQALLSASCPALRGLRLRLRSGCNGRICGISTWCTPWGVHILWLAIQLPGLVLGPSRLHKAKRYCPPPYYFATKLISSTSVADPSGDRCCRCVSRSR